MLTFFETVLVLTLALYVAGLVLLILYLSWVGLVLAAAFVVSLLTFVVTAAPHTPHRWDLPHLMPTWAWERLTAARIRRGEERPWSRV